jgi:hypothetical protein
MFGEKTFNIDTPDILYGWFWFFFCLSSGSDRVHGYSRASEEYRWDGMGFSACFSGEYIYPRVSFVSAVLSEAYWR